MLELGVGSRFVGVNWRRGKIAGDGRAGAASVGRCAGDASQIYVLFKSADPGSEMDLEQLRGVSVFCFEAGKIGSVYRAVRRFDDTIDEHVEERPGDLVDLSVVVSEFWRGAAERANLLDAGMRDVAANYEFANTTVCGKAGPELFE